MLEDEIEQSLLVELTASDLSSCSDDDDSSGTGDLTVVEVIGSECSYNESDYSQCATASSGLLLRVLHLHGRTLSTM